jgi:hypothetical protein
VWNDGQVILAASVESCVFAKATWMFGVNGPTIPQMFWKTFPPTNP